MEDVDDVFIMDKGSSQQFPFDGYQGEKAILIDDYSGWLDYEFLLRVLDKYKLRLNIKGSYTYANWNTVYITSNVRPRFWYRETKNTENLQRRITKVWEVVNDPELGQGHRHDKTVDWAFSWIVNSIYDRNSY
jgi:hypothetical protein